MHIYNHQNQGTYSESLSNLGLFKLLDFHNQRSSFLFSFDLQAFQVSRHLLDSNERFLRWKNNQRKLFSFFLLYASQNSLFSFFFIFCQRWVHKCVLPKNDYLPKVSHMKRENPSGLIGLLWKVCWVKIFYLS